MKKKRILQLASIAAVIAALLTPTPAAATPGPCPGNIVRTPDYTACHLVSGGDCASCRYRCDDGTYEDVNWCET